MKASIKQTHKKIEGSLSLMGRYHLHEIVVDAGEPSIFTASQIVTFCYKISCIPGCVLSMIGHSKTVTFNKVKNQCYSFVSSFISLHSADSNLGHYKFHPIPSVKSLYLLGFPSSVTFDWSLYKMLHLSNLNHSSFIREKCIRMLQLRNMMNLRVKLFNAVLSRVSGVLL